MQESALSHTFSLSLAWEKAPLAQWVIPLGYKHQVVTWVQVPPAAEVVPYTLTLGGGELARGSNNELPSATIHSIMGGNTPGRSPS